jgi:hypothetical protein
MYVGTVLGSLIEELIFGYDEDDVEIETPSDKGTQHKDQVSGDMGEQHAARYDINRLYPETLRGFAVPNSLETALNLLTGNVSSTGNTMSSIFDLLAGRFSESPLGSENETGEAKTTDSSNATADR